MASRFASISEKGILSMNEEAVPKNTKMATKFSNSMVSYLISPASYSKAKIKIHSLVYENYRALKSKWKQRNIWCFSAWFQQQEELRKWDRSNLTSACKRFICRQEDETEHFTIKNRSPRTIRAALKRHLRRPPLNKPLSIISPLFIQLVWYILKQLFTSVSVNNC